MAGRGCRATVDATGISVHISDGVVTQRISVPSSFLVRATASRNVGITADTLGRAFSLRGSCLCERQDRWSGAVLGGQSPSLRCTVRTDSFSHQRS